MSKKNICDICCSEENILIQIAKKNLMIHVCKNCINKMLQKINELESEKIESNTDLTGDEILQSLQKRVKGQNHQLERLAGILKMHHYQLQAERSTEGNDKKLQVNRGNTIIIGDTGTGKTETIRALKDLLNNIPIVIFDGSNLTTTGFVGNSPSSVLEQLINESNGDVSIAERGIVYIEEGDKLASKKTDVTGKSVQCEFLTMLDQCKVPVRFEKNGYFKTIMFDTSKLLFILGGSFAGLKEIKNKRIKENSFGFNKIDNKDELKLDNSIIESDLVKFGFTAEFIGRFPNIITYNDLDKQSIEEIVSLKINKYKKIIESIGKIKLNFSECCIKKITDLALKATTGIRVLTSILYKVMNVIVFKLSNNTLKNKTIDITKEILLSCLKSNNFDLPI